MKRAFLTLAAVALLLGGVGRAKAGFIDTTTNWNGMSYVYAFGVPNTATYGQTFAATASLGTELNSFSFWLTNDYIYGTEPSQFSAYVMAWNGSEATGPVLYTSAPNVLPTTSGFTEFTFNTGGISLSAGSEYVAFLSVSNYYNGDTTTGMGWIPNSDAYIGGEFVYNNNGPNFSLLTISPWEDFGGVDAAFQASFSSPATATPEPASATLLGIGIASMAGYRWRRRRNQAVAA